MSKNGDTIFLLSQPGSLERVPRAEYDSEELLQSLIEKYPDLLAGEQIQPEEPIRWLLVSREAGIPDAEGASDRWAIDHLLLDQLGRPTFVEVKRSTDSRIRRDVVGQMLDYAANAQSYWPIDRIRSMAADRYGGMDSLEEEIHRLLASDALDEPSGRIEAYWSRVDENLRNGHVRLLFVADELPRELRRVIEFLNEQMPRVEVLGIDVRQYAGENLKVLVPRLIGQTEFARQEKRSPTLRARTDARSFLDSCPEDVARFFAATLQEAGERDLVIYWGVKGFSIRVPRHSGELCSVFYGFPPDSHYQHVPFIRAYLGDLSSSDDAEGIRRRFLAVAPFIEKGRFTLDLSLQDESLTTAKKAVAVLWEVSAELRRGG